MLCALILTSKRLLLSAAFRRPSAATDAPGRLSDRYQRPAGHRTALRRFRLRWLLQRPQRRTFARKHSGIAAVRDPLPVQAAAGFAGSGNSWCARQRRPTAELHGPPVQARAWIQIAARQGQHRFQLTDAQGVPAVVFTGRQAQEFAYAGEIIMAFFVQLGDQVQIILFSPIRCPAEPAAFHADARPCCCSPATDLPPDRYQTCQAR